MERKQYINNNDFESELKSFLLRYTRLGAEEVQACDSVGRITASAVFAKYCDPVYNAAAMDGIALRAKATENADERNPVELKLGKDFLYINTGGAIPSGYDAVVMIEDVIDLGEGKIQLLKPAHEMQHIRVVGESVAAFEMLLPPRQRIRPVDVGCIISSTDGKVSVTTKPRVGIIPTGDELIEDIAKLEVGRLMESNTRVFALEVESLGGFAHRYDIVRDDKQKLKEAIIKAAEENDIVIVNAGSSAGTKDFVVKVIAEIGQVFCHGLAIKPGKPTILAQVRNKPVIGIPGYPVSAHLVFSLVLKPLINKLLGVEDKEHEKVEAYLTRGVASSFRSEEFIRVGMGEVGGNLVMTPLERGAAAAMSLVKADGILRIPRLLEGLEAGERCAVTLCKPLSDIKKKLVLIGSHDMIIDFISCQMPISSAHVGSFGGISALLRGASHVAPIHLLDEESGEYNLPFIKEYFSGKKMAIIKGVERVQGFYFKAGQKVTAIEDIKKRKLRFANRQSGAGTRLLFDYLLKKEGISPLDIVGYEKEFTTHLAVAAAISAGEFDTGIGVFSAAKAFGLEFAPLCEESYDFLLNAETLCDERVRRFIGCLKSEAFKKDAKKAGGYNFTHTGEVEVIDC